MGNNDLENLLNRLHAGMLYAAMDACTACGKRGEPQNPEDCLVHKMTKSVMPDFNMPCEVVEGWHGILNDLPMLPTQSGLGGGDEKSFKDWIRGETKEDGCGGDPG